MKRIATLFLALLMLAALPLSLSACKGSKELEKLDGYAASEAISDYVRFNVTYTNAKGKTQTGDIVVKLQGDIAPITVANFQQLVNESFYNGLTFHRVYKGFMIQGGCPKGDGTGDSGTKITGEFSENGIENSISHLRGVISMARGSYSMDSASCQFFIMHKDTYSSSLDGLYAAFGKVVYGMDVVDEIAEVETKYNSSFEKSVPVTDVIIKSVYFVTPQE